MRAAAPPPRRRAASPRARARPLARSPAVSAPRAGSRARRRAALDDELTARAALGSIVSSVTRCRFEASEPGADEVVLMRLLQVREQRRTAGGGSRRAARAG